MHPYPFVRISSRLFLLSALFGLNCLMALYAQGIEEIHRQLIETHARAESMEKDSALTYQYNYLAEAYSGGQDSLSWVYVDSLEWLTSISQWPKTEGLRYRALGKYYDRRGEFEKALEAYSSAIASLEKNNDQTELLAYTYILKAFVLNNNGLHEACRATLEQIRPLADRLENKNYLAWILDWYGDQLFYSAYGKQDFPGALAYYQQVEALLSQVRNNMIKADNAHGLAGCYLRTGQEEKAIEYRNKALAIAKENNLHSVIFAVYGDMADVYDERKKYDEAIRYRLMGLDYARQTGWIEMEARAHKTAAFTFKSAGDFEKALFHFEQLHAIEDSLARYKVQQAYHELEVQYELGKKDLQIEQLKARNLRMYLYILAALLAGGLLFLFYYQHINGKLRIQNQALSVKNQEIRRALTEGQNIERKRMAIELHDNINAKIAAAKWILETINTPEKTSEEQAAINRVVEAMSDIYEDVRFISHNLVPKDIETKTLSANLSQMVENLNRNLKIAFTFTHEGPDEHLNTDMKIQAYAMVMELINNIIRHSECRKASIHLKHQSNLLEIIVEDDGKGFDPEDVSGGTGLKNLQSRVQSVNGQFEIRAGLENGVYIHITIPLAVDVRTTI